ncbi:outer membrane receptor protein involved in Fe transport [Tenacibaculum adriaticum]|uniref:Outer membrane receptor protein involved in Fe transport n=1 Tax=Tenacibaculum adriaticum TaxID=413713 RepID=A0A5S5DJW1_9FLAO|nr:TonB-dependent receptor [Tenacibaculum adriaticum]TYP96253.1 outer membrane receptor protein involved in Fe transport [Tenacibaculum adriaticum]
MNKPLKVTLLLFLFFLGRFLVNAQTKSQPLRLLLPTIEKQYNVSFSYADNTINGVYVNLDFTNLLLTEVLSAIESKTQLRFNQLNDTFITIRKKTASDNFVFQELEEVVVNNYLTSGIYKNNTGSITIKPVQFEILPGLTEPDVLQIIQALPGVISVDETVSNINIRGGTHDQNLLLYDGIRMYQSGHFFGLISAFNPYLTKHVSVIKNGSSAKYGESISGIIDLKLDDEISHKQEFGVGIDLISVDGFAILPLGKKTALQIAARRSITDFANTPTYDQYFKRVFQDSDLTNTNSASISKNEDFYFYDTYLKFLYDISERDKLRINFLSIYNRLNYQEEATINTVNEASDSELKQKSLAGGISYLRNWNDKLTTNAQVYVSKYNLNATNYDILNDQRLIQENVVIDDGIKFDVNYSINSTLQLNTGLQFAEVGISNLEDVNNPLFSSYIKRVLQTYAIYTEGVFQPKNKNSIVKFGVRHNYFEKFDLHLTEPRLHVSQRFLNHFKAELSAELKSQSTSQIIDLQNDFLGIEKRRWVLANNSTIPVLKSKQASFGISFDKNKLLLSAETYIKKVDGITTRSQGFQNQYQFVNATGSYLVKGIDVLINKRFQNFSTWLSYSYSDNNYTFNTLNSGDSFPNNFDITHVVNFAGTYQINKFKIALGLNWHSGKPYTQPENMDSNTIVYQIPNSSRLEDYLKVGFSSSYQFNLGKHKAHLGLSIWNVLDKKNIINTYYTNTGDMISKIENQSLGFTPNLNFRVRF